MMLYALPRSFGWKRLIVGPGSAQALAMNSVLRTGVVLCSLALATALRTTFSIITLARFLEKRSMASASSTSRPRIKSITSRALRGAIRANRCLASNGISTSFGVRASARMSYSFDNSMPCGLKPARRSLSCRCGCGRRTGGGFGGLLAGVAAENPGRRKLAELVADHVFLHEHLQELVPVVNLERVAHKLRDDRACTGPCPDGLLGLVLVETIHFFVKLLVDVGAFFGTATHVISKSGAQRLCR